MKNSTPMMTIDVVWLVVEFGPCIALAPVVSSWCAGVSELSNLARPQFPARPKAFPRRPLSCAGDDLSTLSCLSQAHDSWAQWGLASYQRPVLQVRRAAIFTVVSTQAVCIGSATRGVPLRKIC